MKWLFVDHECHIRTGSTKFFLDIVRKRFLIDEHYYCKYYQTGIESLLGNYDGVIIWEFPVSRNKFFFRGKRNLFVPMYDNEWASFWQWKRIAWSGMGVISFCEKVTQHAVRCGVKNILTVRYFPDPKKFPKEKGEAKRVFLWERGDISKEAVERLFPKEKGYTFDVKSSDEFLGRDDYFARLAACQIVVAPRCKEGIGMAFLEAMAMGKCVVAHNDATMNEYITDGVNGILFNASLPSIVDEKKVEKVNEGIEESVNRLYMGWKKDEAKITDFLVNQKPLTPSVVNRIKIFFSYPLYLLEGIYYVVKSKCKSMFENTIVKAR
jgi:hypothetical protein